MHSDLYVTLCMSHTQTPGKRLIVNALKSNVELIFVEPHASVSQAMAIRNEIRVYWST